MRVIALIAISIVLAACGSAGPSGGNPLATPTQTTSTSPTTSTAPTPSPAATPSPSPSPSPTCSFPLQGGTAASATIADVRVGSHTGYDRLVIEYSGRQPAYKLVPQDPGTFVGPFSGLPVSVAGHAGLHLFIYNMDIPPTFLHGTNLKPGYSELKQVVVMAVFEGRADIAIGLDRLECPTVSVLSSPSRLVIDFPSH
jgi:hypothetical protein